MTEPLFIDRAYLDNCTIGKAYHAGKFVFYTLERPWQSNQPWNPVVKTGSCIPAGEYTVVPHVSKSKGDVFAIINRDLGVTLHGPSTRTYIYFHAANWPHQLQGCIAPGLELHPDTWGVAKSGLAFAELQRIKPDRVIIR